MSKLYKENGFLSEEGERLFKEILDAKINLILKQGGDEAEIRLLGSLIQKRVGDLVSEKITARNEVATKFSAMTDDEFEGYLRAKYGTLWMLSTLTPEEFERCPSLNENRIKEALEKGQKAREEMQRNMPRLSARLTRTRFR